MIAERSQVPRLRQFLPVAFCVVSALTLGPVQAQPEDIVHAQRMPLAVASLLLDATRADSGRLVVVGERGHVLHSEDGSDWRQAESVPTRSTLTTVTTGPGGRLWAAGHDSVIISSDDGGVTWKLHYFDPERQQPIMDIHFADDGRGFAVGAYALMLVSDDGGDTWEDHYVSDEEWHFNAMLELPGGRMVIAGEAGFSYLSEDGGETWTVIEMPYPGSMFGIARGADDCLLQFGLRGNLQRSCDGGLGWEPLDPVSEATLNDAARSGDTLLLVGNSGALLERRGAREFIASQHPSGVDFAAAIPLPDGRFLLVGEDGLHHHPAEGVLGPP